MTSTLLTCTSSTRPGSPGLGDTLYETDTDKIITCSNETGPVWQEYDSDGVGGDDLAYAGARTGNPTSGTNYVITAQPDCHYDAAKYVTLSASAATLGGAVDDWGDRSGNDNDATANAILGATYEPTYVKNHGNFGLQWPSSRGLGRMETSYTPTTPDPPGHTIVVAVTPPSPISHSLCSVVENQGAAGYQSAGMKMPPYPQAGSGPMIQSVDDTTIYVSTKKWLALQYTQVFTIYDYDGDQKIFTNLEEVFTGSVSYTQADINNRLDSVYWLGASSWLPGTYGSFGQEGTKGHGGIMYEVLIFTSALSYTSDGTDLTGGNLKIVVDYLMNKYGVTTNFINSAS
jgi:hypothetical protein